MDELLNTAPCGFVTFLDDGTITTINDTLIEMLGVARADVEGHSIERILTVGSRIFYQTHLFPLVRMHSHAEEIFMLLRAGDGADVAVLANVVRRQRGDRHENDCVFVRVRERQKFEAELLRARREAEAATAESERHQAELTEANMELEQQTLELEITAEEMQALNERLELRTIELERLRQEADHANQAKSNFLAMMSHELRTPLNAISGYAQILEMGVQGPVTETQKESLQRIQQSQRHLLRLVNEILNLARIEAGHVEYNITSVSVDNVVRPVLPLVEPQMAQTGVTLQVEVPAELAVNCDVEKTQQILLNLLSNAVKFTRSGGVIRVAAEQAGDSNSAEEQLVTLSVSDTGIGIPAEMLETIFDPFVQVEMSPSRRGEGTGLGLAISRDLAKGMGGSLRATSEPGVGSTFYLTLPVAAMPASQPGRHPVPING